MKKKTKKLILEILDFWPMTIVVPAMLILILFGAALGWGGLMIWLLLSIILSGLLVYMIFLSNEMSKICNRLLDRTKKLMNKIDKIIKD